LHDFFSESASVCCYCHANKLLLLTPELQDQDHSTAYIPIYVCCDHSLQDLDRFFLVSDRSCPKTDGLRPHHCPWWRPTSRWWRGRAGQRTWRTWSTLQQNRVDKVRPERPGRDVFEI